MIGIKLTPSIEDVAKMEFSLLTDKSVISACFKYHSYFINQCTNTATNPVASQRREKSAIPRRPYLHVVVVSACDDPGPSHIKRDAVDGSAVAACVVSDV